MVLLVDMSPGVSSMFLTDRHWLLSVTKGLFAEFPTSHSLRVSLMLATPSCKVLVGFDEGKDMEAFNHIMVLMV